MIKLTTVNGSALYVRPSTIDFEEDKNAGTIVYFQGTWKQVVETPQEILKKMGLVHPERL